MLLILLGAVVVALVVGMIDDPSHGWYESLAIFISVDHGTVVATWF